jgi:hypothetical protein
VHLVDVVPYLVEDALKAQGANFLVATDWAVHVSRTGGWSPGKNPAIVAAGRPGPARRAERRSGKMTQEVHGPMRLRRGDIRVRQGSRVHRQLSLPRLQESVRRRNGNVLAVPEDDFTDRGSPKKFHYTAASGKGLDRNFCPDCAPDCSPPAWRACPGLVFVALAAWTASN